jgi:VWFA-related protein
MLVRKQIRVVLESLVIIAFVTMTIPSLAAKRVTVAQLEQVLNADRAEHKQDAEIARQILSIELSERLSDTTLDRLSKQFASGSASAMALLLLADMSAFLELPPSELPPTPIPDDAIQQRVLDAAKRFAVETLPRLPNLLAMRTTFSFDNSPQEVTKGGYAQPLGLHLVGSAKTEVSVRSEREKPPTGIGAAPSQSTGGLSTWGEFGSTLLIILSDTAQGKITWSHWEQTSSGEVAVFRYEVPKNASHYEIDTPIEHLQPNGGSSRWAWAGGGRAMTDTPSTKMLRSKPGYQGLLWVEPATGDILRVSLVADMRGNPTFEHGAILVEYGPVKIADKVYICPVRSLALYSAHPNVDTTVKGATTEWLNENLFTGYHIFASTSRILAESTPSSAPVSAPSSADANAGTPAANQSDQQTSNAAAPLTQQPEQSLAESQPPKPAVPIASQNETEKAPLSAPEIASKTMPTGNDPHTQQALVPQSGPPRLVVNVNRVLVPVVVRDKQGRSINDLKKEDFKIFDNDKPRTLSGFTIENRGAVTASRSSTGNISQVPNTANAASQVAALPARITVFLFDDLHLSAEQLPYVQRAGVKALEGALANSDMAGVVITSGKTNSGITRDRTKLQDAIMSLRPTTLYRSTSVDCPNIDYYQADLIKNKHDPTALQDAILQVLVCNPTTPAMAEQLAVLAASRVVTAGQQDVHVTFDTISEYVSRMANLPGERTLILVSPGFLTITPEAFAAESRIVELAAQSNVKISALDARGVYTSELTASDDTRGRSGQSLVDLNELRRSSLRNADGVMRELTDGTGGTFFHNSNDLGAGFKGLTETPETVYVLEFPLENAKADGRYHELKVKVDRDGAQVQARRGYFLSKAEKSK